MSAAVRAVAVIGAGPAGLAAAIALRAEGVPARVFERGSALPVRLPETLYDAARSELGRLGVASPRMSGASVRFVSADGALALRMDMEAGGRLPVIDRAELDVALREAAAAAGAELCAGRGVAAIERVGPAPGGPWRLSGPDGASDADLVVDATGKAALASTGPLAALAGRSPLDPRGSVFTHFERVQPFGIEVVSLVAAPSGFFYLVPLNPNRLCVGWVSYADECPDEARFLAAIAASPPVRALVADATRVLPTIAAKNGETRVDAVAVPGLFVVGDALGFHDPFMWDGVGHALGSGRVAGEFAAAVALGRMSAEDAASGYAGSLKRIERRSAIEADAALAAFGAAFQPAMLLDPHMPPPLLSSLLGFGGREAEASPVATLRGRRGGGSRRAAA